MQRKNVTPPCFSRRDFLKGIGGAAAGMALSACAAPAGTARHISDAVQLVYQDWRTEWFPAMAQAALDKFHTDHPGICVFYSPDPEDFEERMTADFQAGTAPDVLAGCCDLLPIWAQKGYLLDLRPYVGADLGRQAIDDWDQAQYRAFFTGNGLQFALPKYHGALALYYNKDMLDAQNVSYPDGTWNYDDYHEAQRRLTRRGADGRTSVWGSMADITWERIQVHVNAWGGHFVDPADATHCMMDSPESLDAMRWLRDRMWDDHTMASFLDVQNLETRQAFIQGRLAMVEDGSWALKDILENAGFRFGVAAMPTGPARRATLATTDGFAIFAGTKHPDAAWELLRFLISPDYGWAMLRAHLLQPVCASLVQEWVEHIRQSYPDRTAEVDIEAFAAGHLAGYSVTAEIFSNMADARRIAGEAWDQIFTLGRAPVESMIEATAQIQLAQRKAS
jgi:multiple sugar transport system substrate-binding protein